MKREDLLALLRPIWAEDLRQRQQKHGHRMRSLAAEAAAKGIGASGAHVAAAFDACTEESRTPCTKRRAESRDADSDKVDSERIAFALH